MSIWNDFVKPIVVLGVICLVTSALLAVTNNATAPIIEKNAKEVANAARRELLPAADDFKLMDATAENVTEMYEATNGAGYVLTAQSKGYGGQVPVMVAFDKDGVISAVKFLDNSETPGLGQKVKSEAFQGQFAGMKNENFGLSAIDAISGATISSGAAVSAINAAIDLYNKEVGGVEKIELTPEQVREKILPDAGAITLQSGAPEGVTEWYKGESYGTVIYVEVPGFYKKPLIAAVGFDDSGVITGTWFNADNETDGVGKQIGTDQAFADQFIGKTAATPFDAVAGATVSSTAAADAVQKAIDGYNAIQGG